MATTTSTYDSGLLDFLLPEFESAYGAQVDVIAVGTGQAIALGERGDADVLLVHARAKEEAFVAAGHGSARHPVMFNDFVLVGPREDPAGIAGLDQAATALTRIAESGSTFASRGDDSGTHTRELALWSDAGIEPSSQDPWYLSLGQGMGETLRFADEHGSYTLSDRGTFLALQESLPRLAVMVGGERIADNLDPSLLNPYSVIQVNPEVHPEVNAELASEFIDWLLSLETQERIASFGLDRFGQALFYPDSEPWRAAHP